MTLYQRRRGGGGPRRYILAPGEPSRALALLLAHYGACPSCKDGPDLCPRGIELADAEAAETLKRQPHVPPASSSAPENPDDPKGEKGPGRRI